MTMMLAEESLCHQLLRDRVLLRPSLLAAFRLRQSTEVRVAGCVVLVYRDYAF